MRAIRRPRANSVHHNLFVRGKGDVDREIPIPTATYKAPEAWLRVHPQRQGGGLRDDNVIFREPRALRHARGDVAAGAREALAPLRRRRRRDPAPCASTRAAWHYATTLASEHVPIQEIKARLGHASIETTARYFAELADGGGGVGTVLDRHHEEQRRRRQL